MLDCSCELAAAAAVGRSVHVAWTVVNVCVCAGCRELDDDVDDDVILANSAPLKRTRSLGRLSRRWLTRHGLGSKGAKPKGIVGPR